MDAQASGSPSRREERAGPAGALGKTKFLPLPVMKPPRRSRRRFPGPAGARGLPPSLRRDGCRAEGGAFEEGPLNPARGVLGLTAHGRRWRGLPGVG